MHGLRQIVRFNWPFYAAAAAMMLVISAANWTLPGESFARVSLTAATALTAIWFVGSLVASWIIYDWSPLARWEWVGDALGFRPRRWVNIHTGLDQSTPAVRQLFAPSHGRVFDIFDPVEMSEPSIARARRLCPPAIPPEAVDYHRLPARAKSIDAVFLLLSAHELRREAARDSLFDELQRVLSPEGRVIVAEHLRNGANFAAFGPGFLHFFSRRTWARCFARSRFAIEREFSITPFIRVFVLRRSM
jgi:SAM-dependent methyltransferase